MLISSFLQIQIPCKKYYLNNDKNWKENIKPKNCENSCKKIEFYIFSIQTQLFR